MLCTGNGSRVLDDNYFNNVNTYSFNESLHNITLQQRTISSTWLLLLSFTDVRAFARLFTTPDYLLSGAEIGEFGFVTLVPHRAI